VAALLQAIEAVRGHRGTRGTSTCWGPLRRDGRCRLRSRHWAAKGDRGLVQRATLRDGCRIGLPTADCSWGLFATPEEETLAAARLKRTRAGKACSKVQGKWAACRLDASENDLSCGT